MSTEHRNGLGKAFFYFLPELRSDAALITASFAALSAHVALRLLEPWPIKFVFDRILGGPLSADATTLLTLAALSLMMVIGLRALAEYASTIGFARVGSRLVSRVRERLYRHLQYMSLSFHVKSRTGDLVLRVVSDVSMLQDVTVTAVLPILAKGLIIIGMLALTLTLHWQLAVVALLPLPLFWIRAARLNRKIQEVAKRQRSREGAMAATAAEALTAIRTVQALSMSESFADSFCAQSEKNTKDDIKGKRLSAGLERWVDVMIGVSTALVLWYGATLVLAGGITAGDLIVFLSYMKYTYRPVQDLVKYANRLGKASAAADRVIELFERTPDVQDLPGAAAAPAFQGRVTFEQVNFEYEPGSPTLSDVNLEIRPGQRTAIVGPSGSGKSTLVSLILRLYDPKQGRVCVDGRDIRDYTIDSLRSQIGVILQDALLFASSVRDNIGSARLGATAPEIEGAARLANAHEFISEMPEGYDTVLGERGVTLSHGQRQRLAIARAAVRKAPIVILDEPTTGLDKANERQVIEALGRLLQGRTTFWITHDLQGARSADLILYMENGRILERGTHDELIERDGRYAALFSVQESGAAA